MKKNLFIALEGIDGSGKSTQTAILNRRLTNAGHKVYATFEPTDSQIGTMIRSILKGTIKVDEYTIAALFVADRLDHLMNEEYGIIKKLEDGYTVITDRFYFSSYAYHGTHIDMDWVINANAMSAKLRKPDVNIFIDVSPETSMRRVQRRSKTELYENLENLTKVRSNYLTAFEKLAHQETIETVNGNQSLELISKDIWSCVEKMIASAL